MHYLNMLDNSLHKIYLQLLTLSINWANMLMITITSFLYPIDLHSLALTEIEAHLIEAVDREGAYTVDQGTWLFILGFSCCITLYQLHQFPYVFIGWVCALSHLIYFNETTAVCVVTFSALILDRSML